MDDNDNETGMLGGGHFDASFIPKVRRWLQLISTKMFEFVKMLVVHSCLQAHHGGAICSSHMTDGDLQDGTGRKAGKRSKVDDLCHNTPLMTADKVERGGGVEWYLTLFCAPMHAGELIPSI